MIYGTERNSCYKSGHKLVKKKLYKALASTKVDFTIYMKIKSYTLNILIKFYINVLLCNLRPTARLNLFGLFFKLQIVFKHVRLIERSAGTYVSSQPYLRLLCNVI